MDSGGTPKTSSSQCDECQKWRVINTEEEFEDIRSKLSEEPFCCNKKPGMSCDDPADIEYNNSRTWVIDKPDLQKTPEGFKRHLVLRRDYSKLDAYYITPKGKKVRTRNEIAAFLKENPMYEGISASDFDFASPKVMEDTIPESFGKKGSGISSGGSHKKLKTPKEETGSNE